MQSFIEQVFIKVSIFVTKKAHGDLTTDKTESEYFLQVVYELLTIRPNAIEIDLSDASALVKDSNLLYEDLQERVLNLEEQVDDFIENVLEKE